MPEKSQQVDAQELNKFESLARQWWDPHGKLRTLHHINPVRLHYIDKVAGLEGKSVLDLGCGGGLLTESMAAKGAQVTGLDASDAVIDIAKAHRQQSGRQIEYITGTVEQFAQDHRDSFDVITCMELLEHVPDAQSLLASCETILKPGGDLILATINRTVTAYVTAILGAEYLLGLLPRRTHDYAKFVKPSELCTWLRHCGFRIEEVTGMTYLPGVNTATLTGNPSVNYLVHARLKE
ncbi:MAG: bifunctional 2-polyprenyl-6-hydroxyphenol methylase/3-demethylubiquinol 3-O-methyltransferase UbiG [Gammaproteobacteria bacterium]